MSGSRRFHVEAASSRFWKQINKLDNGCWEWQAGRNQKGYGKFHPFWAYHNIRPIIQLAHRYSWELHFGEIAEGLCVLHRCDNPPCCRPDHLWLGTEIDNNSDRDAKGRTKKIALYCPRGHLKTGDNLMIWRNERWCLLCKREYWRQQQRKRKSAVRQPKEVT